MRGAERVGVEGRGGGEGDKRGVGGCAGMDEEGRLTAAWVCSMVAWLPHAPHTTTPPSRPTPLSDISNRTTSPAACTTSRLAGSTRASGRVGCSTVTVWRSLHRVSSTMGRSYRDTGRAWAGASSWMGRGTAGSGWMGGGTGGAFRRRGTGRAFGEGSTPITGKGRGHSSESLRGYERDKGCVHRRAWRGGVDADGCTNCEV